MPRILESFDDFPFGGEGRSFDGYIVEAEAGRWHSGRGAAAVIERNQAKWRRQRGRSLGQSRFKVDPSHPRALKLALRL